MRSLFRIAHVIGTAALLCAANAQAQQVTEPGASTPHERALEAERQYKLLMADIEATNAQRQSAPLPSLSVEDLCVLLRQGSRTGLLAELSRRKAFTAAELQAIQAQHVFIGMSHTAALCSWGKPQAVHRTTTARITHEQLVYGDNYLYSTNGKITAIQN